MSESTSGTNQDERADPKAAKAEAKAKGSEPQPASPPLEENSQRSHSDQLRLLVEVNATLAAALDAESVLGQILARLSERANLAHAAIYRLNTEERLLRCIAHSIDATPEPNYTWSLDGPGLPAWVARHLEPAYVPEVANDPRCLCGDLKVHSEYAVPLLAGPNVLGVLDIQSDQSDGIRATTRKLVDQFAAQAAMAMERSELYRRLQSSEQRFRSIFEQGRFGVGLCNLQGEFFTVNPAFARLLGYEPEELQGRHFLEITHPEDHLMCRMEVDKLMAGRANECVLEKRYVHKSGEAIWCITGVSLVRDALGRPAYSLAIIQDIREQRKAEEERARFQEQLFQSQKMEALGTLAGGIAHDFNNLLSVIMGFASLVRDRLGTDDPLQDPLKMIEQSAERAADLTHQLLGFARREKQKAQSVSVREVLERVVKMVEETFDRRITIQGALGADLPCVEAERSLLEQAVLNLCINARDAMPEGGTLTLGASVTSLDPQEAPASAQSPSGRYLRISVRDTGVGMEPHVMQRIFEPFFTTKEPGKGTGLGLAMVYRFVNNHGGFVRVESEVGSGSQFALYLPAVEAPRAPARIAEGAQLQRGNGTVLVVDDEPMVLAFTEQGLKRLGYQVLAAENGQQALEIFHPRAREISCVLVDMVMPELSGLETCRRLRQINPQVRVILTSGYNTSGLLQEAREAGAADFIGKPYTLAGLSATLQKHVPR